VFGKKSKAVIKQRREAKQAVVEFLISCAEQHPIALLDKTLAGDGTGSLFVALSEFTPTIEKDRAALETAKGCTKPSQMMRTGHTGTLYAFMQLYKLGENGGCFSSWIQDGVEWAKHIVEQNPHSFPTGWTPFQRRVDAAKSSFSVDDAAYRKNPTKGPPQNADQALYYLVYQAGEIWFTEFGESQSSKGEAAKAWLAKFNLIAPDVRDNPSVRGLHSKGLDWAVTRYEKWYINGELPV